MKTSDLEQLRAFAEAYTAAWCSMDPPAVAAHYAPEGYLAINEALPDMQVYFDLVVEEIGSSTTGPSPTRTPDRVGRATRCG